MKTRIFRDSTGRLRKEHQIQIDYSRPIRPQLNSYSDLFDDSFICEMQKRVDSVFSSDDYIKGNIRPCINKISDVHYEILKKIFGRNTIAVTTISHNKK